MSSSTAAPSGEITGPKALSYDSAEGALTSVIQQLLDVSTKSYKLALEEKEARMKQESDTKSKLSKKLEDMRVQKESDSDDEEAKLKEEEDLLDNETESMASGKPPEVGTVASDVKKRGKDEEARQARLSEIRNRIKAKRLAQARMIARMKASEDEEEMRKKEEAKKKLEDLKGKIADVKKRVEEAKKMREEKGVTPKMEAAAGKAAVGSIKEEATVRPDLTGAQEQPIPNYWTEIMKATKKFRENGTLTG